MMKESLKATYYVLQKILGKERQLLRRVRSEGLVTVLNFHQVTPRINPFWPPLTPSLFENLLLFLKRHFEVVAFRDIESIKSKKPLLVISFDDGYKNFLEYAIPLLEKHGLTSNMNIIPKCVEEDQPIWNVKMYDFLNAAPKKLIDEINLPGFNVRLRDNSSGSKLQYGLGISKFLKNRSQSDRSALLEELEHTMEKCDFALTRMMNADEIKQISMFHEIGVHSYSHASMEYEGADFFEEDLERCRAFFADELDLPMNIYAFPNGSHKQEQIKMLQNSSIRSILLVGEKHTIRGSNIFNRFTIYGNSSLENRFQSLGYDKSLH